MINWKRVLLLSLIGIALIIGAFSYYFPKAFSWTFTFPSYRNCQSKEIKFFIIFPVLVTNIREPGCYRER